MKKTVFHFFIDFVDGQEKWLNQMAEKGYRLLKCGKAWYTFEKDQPNKYEYAVELVGNHSFKTNQDYKAFLDNMGYRTLYKNININFSLGKIAWRPWAKGMGQITTNPGGFNRELLIIEKQKDGKPFNLHTDFKDMLSGYHSLRNAYLWAILQMLALTVIIIVLFFYQKQKGLDVRFIFIALLPIIFGILFAIPMMKYTTIIRKLKQESNTYE